MEGQLQLLEENNWRTYASTSQGQRSLCPPPFISATRKRSLAAHLSSRGRNDGPEWLSVFGEGQTAPLLPHQCLVRFVQTWLRCQYYWRRGFLMPAEQSCLFLFQIMIMLYIYYRSFRTTMLPFNPLQRSTAPQANPSERSHCPACIQNALPLASPRRMFAKLLALWLK